MRNRVLNAEQEYRAFRASLGGFIRDLVLSVFFLIGLYYFISDKDKLIAFSFVVLAPVLVNLPGIIYFKTHWLKEKYSLNLLKFYEWGALTILVLSGSGSIYLWYLPIQFDCFVHFVETFLAALMVVVALSIWKERKGEGWLPAAEASSHIVLIGIIISLLWELYQFTGDLVLGTKMFYDAYQTALLDSLTDVLSGIVGTLLGAKLLSERKRWEFLRELFLRK